MQCSYRQLKVTKITDIPHGVSFMVKTRGLYDFVFLSNDKFLRRRVYCRKDWRRCGYSRTCPCIDCRNFQNSFGSYFQ